MNIKKYLRKRAEEDAEALITETDRIFCKQLAELIVEQHREEKLKRKKGKINKHKD